MPKGRTRSESSVTALQKDAFGLPGVVGGIACAGTALESRTATVRGKAFLFLGPDDVRLKLGPSLAHAQDLARSSPGVRPGAGGWVTISHEAVATLSRMTLRSWVRESHGLFAGGRRPIPTKSPRPLRDGANCRVIGGVHNGESGIVRDIKTGPTGHVSITVVPANGVRFKTLARNVSVET